MIILLKNLAKLLDDLIDNETTSLTINLDTTKGCTAEKRDLFFENLIDALKVNVSLHHLEFSKILTWCPNFQRDFGEILANNNTIEYLSLSYNDLTDNMLMSMANILRRNKSIHTLDISSMGVSEDLSDEARDAFLDALAQNKHLAHLMIAYSAFTEPNSLALLQQAMELNTSIIVIDHRVEEPIILGYVARNIETFKTNLKSLTQDDSPLTIDDLLILKNQILAVKYDTEHYYGSAFRELESKTQHSLFNVRGKFITKKADETQFLIKDLFELVGEYANPSVESGNLYEKKQQAVELLSFIEDRIDQCLYERSPEYLNAPRL